MPSIRGGVSSSNLYFTILEAHSGGSQPATKGVLVSCRRTYGSPARSRAFSPGFAVHLQHRSLGWAVNSLNERIRLRAENDKPPRFSLLPETDRRSPYPLSWDEQRRLLQELPKHLATTALFKVSTGCREAEVRGLRWDWEVAVPELDTSVFLIPAAAVKNREERLVVLNRVARSVADGQRG